MKLFLQSLRRVLCVLWALLTAAPLGNARPPAPPVNCSLMAAWAGPQPSSTNTSTTTDTDVPSTALRPAVLLQGNAVPTTSTSTLKHADIHHQPFPKSPSSYDGDVGDGGGGGSDSSTKEDDRDYFDYYYEEPEDSFSTTTTTTGRSDDGRQQAPPPHQPPPGLNRVAKLKLMKTPRRQPPEYMLELYDRFSRERAATSPVTTRSPEESQEDQGADLGADIVRSFPNINKEDDGDVTGHDNDDDEESDVREGEEDPEPAAGRETRQHTLVFNLTSVVGGERVSRAELRLYTLVEQDRQTYEGDERRVQVYEGLRRSRGSATAHLPPVAQRRVHSRSGRWEAFDVTSVVRDWVRRGSRTGDGVHVLEVKIDSVFQQGGGGGGGGGTAGAGRAAAPALDIDADPEHNEGPLLVVFSRDTSSHLQHELQNLIDHESLLSHSDRTSSESSREAEPVDVSDDVEEKTPSKRERPLVSERLTRELFLPATVSPLPETPLRRARREGWKRNSCRRSKMYVSFQEIDWQQWIIAPNGYQAFECVGKCYVPIGAHLSPTKHAIIQTLMHHTDSRRAARACCVPTKLEPISILYLDENNVITYKYHYDGMVVKECGCR